MVAGALNGTDKDWKGIPYMECLGVDIGDYSPYIITTIRGALGQNPDSISGWSD